MFAKGPSQTGKVVCQTENKTKFRESKSHNILQVTICNKGRTCFIFIRDLLSYSPHIKFLGITFDNRMTFTKHFEEILEPFNQKFHRLRILVNKKWGPSPETILQIYNVLRLPKYVSARLLHEASGLPYVKERLISVGQNHLARMHANPLVEHTMNSAKTNIAWDK